MWGRSLSSHPHPRVEVPKRCYQFVPVGGFIGFDRALDSDLPEHFGEMGPMEAPVNFFIECWAKKNPSTRSAIASSTVAWGDLVTVQPRIENGYLYLPTGPGWGTEVNEEAVREHPGHTVGHARAAGD